MYQVPVYENYFKGFGLVLGQRRFFFLSLSVSGQVSDCLQIEISDIIEASSSALKQDLTNSMIG